MKTQEVTKTGTKGTWMATRTGRQINPGTMMPQDVSIEDIAWALSNLCRYNGHCDHFYPVAQHSVYVSFVANDPRKGLMHDGTEAYVGDVVRPVKHRPEMEVYRNLEDRVMNVISEAFQIKGEMMDADTKMADNIVLLSEKDQIMSNSPDWGWGSDIPRMDYKITEMHPREAHRFFMARFHQLYPELTGTSDMKHWLMQSKRWDETDFGWNDIVAPEAEDVYVSLEEAFADDVDRVLQEGLGLA